VQAHSLGWPATALRRLCADPPVSRRA
jgi:hypothetical protein